MKLKNANPSGCNLIINNLQSTINLILFPKILKIEIIKGFQSLF